MSTERIGIIGASGDLGQRLTVQACAMFESVITFDTTPRAIPKDAIGVDENVNREDMLYEPVRALSAMNVIKDADIVHWAAPTEAVHVLPSVSTDALLIFHDSVMDVSRQAVALRTARDQLGRTAIVHCLMNSNNRVVIAEESEEPAQAYHHFSQLELEPTLLPYRRHDQIMAESQAPMALLHELLADQLAAYDADGLLTPSGHDLMEAINARAAKWTSATLQSILHNPELPELIEKMRTKTNGRKEK